MFRWVGGNVGQKGGKDRSGKILFYQILLFHQVKNREKRISFLVPNEKGRKKIIPAMLQKH